MESLPERAMELLPKQALQSLPEQASELLPEQALQSPREQARPLYYVGLALASLSGPFRPRGPPPKHAPRPLPEQALQLLPEQAPESLPEQAMQLLQEQAPESLPGPGCSQGAAPDSSPGPLDVDSGSSPATCRTCPYSGSESEGPAVWVRPYRSEDPPE
jgi:hypothetical protein